MVSQQLLNRVSDDVERHCAAKGYVRGPNWNPLTPWDSVAAFAMARSLIQSGQFDDYVTIAPEGHVYGYFFECLGTQPLCVSVDYPPKRVDLVDDLKALRGRRVLLIEDDIISGVSLNLVVRELARYAPRSLSLYLGREKDSQQLQNVPPPIAGVYLAEDHLDPAERERYGAEFVEFFRSSGSEDPDLDAGCS
jgi:hypothetical protein